jgi:hypothetical protein
MSGNSKRDRLIGHKPAKPRSVFIPRNHKAKVVGWCFVCKSEHLWREVCQV